jgi:hypothetical protein
VKPDTNFIKYCLQSYQTPLFNKQEFDNDINRLIILKKSFKRYDTTGKINIRLVLNNIIILINVFGVESANIVLFYRLGERYYSHIKTILQFIDCYVENSITKDIDEDEIIYNLLKDEVNV